MSNEISISPSLENYIKVIFELCQENVAVRVTDLAEKLSIAKSSVNQAIKVLDKLGLVRYERYGPLELTDKGRELADNIARRNRVIKAFLTVILKVNPEVAEKDACLMEHVVSPVTMEKLTRYLETQVNMGLADSQMEEYDIGSMSVQSLNQVMPGIKAKVMRLTAKGEVKKRMMDMGIIAGTELEVEKVAPMGDPIEIKIRGYHLAIRKSEAQNIFVEILI